jgi:hypothetical protein
MTAWRWTLGVGSQRPAGRRGETRTVRPRGGSGACRTGGSWARLRIGPQRGRCCRARLPDVSVAGAGCRPRRRCLQGERLQVAVMHGPRASPAGSVHSGRTWRGPDRAVWPPVLGTAPPSAVQDRSPGSMRAGASRSAWWDGTRAGRCRRGGVHSSSQVVRLAVRRTAVRWAGMRTRGWRRGGHPRGDVGGDGPGARRHVEGGRVGDP